MKCCMCHAGEQGQQVLTGLTVYSSVPCRNSDMPTECMILHALVLKIVASSVSSLLSKASASVADSIITKVFQ